MKSKVLGYVDFQKANNLLEGFNKSTGFVTAILDLDGNVLSKSGWRQICTEFHRKNSESALCCKVSDTELANKMLQGEKFHFYECQNGLVDVAIPLIIRGEHYRKPFYRPILVLRNQTFFSLEIKLNDMDSMKRNILRLCRKCLLLQRKKLKY